MSHECLVVDDSRMIRAIARSMLEAMGLQVAEAVDGEEGLARCQQKMPDLILVDWNMPGISGYDLICAVRAMPGVAQPPIILSSTESREEKITEVLAAGASAYLSKPFDKATLERHLSDFGLLG